MLGRFRQVSGIAKVVNLWSLLIHHAFAEGAAYFLLVRVVLVNLMVSVLVQLLHAHLVVGLRDGDVAVALAFCQLLVKSLEELTEADVYLSGYFLLNLGRNVLLVVLPSHLALIIIISVSVVDAAYSINIVDVDYSVGC
jgi:hypothetical protein